MGSSPLVSVIIPFFNAQAFLEEAIASVFAQSYPAWEIVLVDDGSTDGSTEIARHYARDGAGRVRCFEHDEHRNRGLSASRNVALDHARGELIALLDADDAWLPHKLERQVALLQAHPHANVIYGHSEYWRSWTARADAAADEIPDLGVHIRLDTVIEPPSLLILNYPLGLAAAPPPCDVMFRRSTLQRVGGFEEAFGGINQMYEDQAFFAKLYLSENVYVSSECWDRYRQHDASIGAVGSRAGHYEAVRRFFLEWLRGYLRRLNIHRPDVWQAFNLAAWPYLSEGERVDAVRTCGATEGLAPGVVPVLLEGAHDAANCETISGWAWDAERPAAVLTVQIFDSDRLLLTLPAHHFRRDLLAAGKGDGAHAFTCRLPPWLRDGQTHQIWAKIAGSGAPLPSTPRVLTCAADELQRSS